MKTRQAHRQRRAGDGFVAMVREGVLPLLVWGAHFGFAYVGVALSCVAGWAPAHITALLLAGSALAVLWLAWLLLAATVWRPSWQRRVRRVRAGAAVLALVAVLWATLPVWWLSASPCRDPVAAAGR
jgi:hypothetical protein